MKLIINGEDRDVEETTLSSLLTALGFGDKPVVIELNQKALSPSEFESQTLKEGDQLEIITIAAGG